MIEWHRPATSCNSQQQQQHAAPSSSELDDPWMLNVRHCGPYVYMKDVRDDDIGRRCSRLARYDMTGAAYEPAFVDCSALFVSQHHQRAGLQSTHDDISRLHENSSTQDFQKDTWTATDYQTSQRRQHQLNYTSQ